MTKLDDLTKGQVILVWLMEAGEFATITRPDGDIHLTAKGQAFFTKISENT